ncbi:DUF6502 family protein [Roseateles sp.]|uniref:DUF6502 family protein n=1 Tax=Roseateles sp. TaxID=1971397 RepID=UPI0039EAA51F
MNSNSREQVLHIAALLMRPLIRLMTLHGIGLNDLVELAKRIYVEQAERQLQREGRRVTDAALSTMTGVHRKDVKRIVEAGPLPLADRRKRSLLDSVMSLWSGDPRFIDERGAPRVLERRSSVRETAQPSFEDLIEEVTKGVPPKALLDSWLQQHAVRLDEQGRVCWAAPEQATGEELQSLGRSALGAADRLEAAWAQTYGPYAGQWLFSVRGYGLLDEDVQALHRFVRRWGRRFGDRLNKSVTAAQARGLAQGGTQRYSFGVHSHAEAIAAGAAPEEEAGEQV